MEGLYISSLGIKAIHGVAQKKKQSDTCSVEHTVINDILHFHWMVIFNIAVKYASTNTRGGVHCIS